MTLDDTATTGGPGPASEAPEHDWSTATPMLFPVLRPPGTQGVQLADFDRTKLTTDGLRSHAQPLIDPGPVDLVLAYALRTPGFDILVNADHLVSWGVDPDALRTTALENVRAWSSSAPWTDELSGPRRLLASDSGGGCDAARILLPEVRQHLQAELGGDARVMVALPDRNLLVAGGLRADDPEFARQFASFAADLSGDADEPIDHRVFELVNGELRPFELSGA
jgi:hypothetical protein